MIERNIRELEKIDSFKLFNELCNMRPTYYSCTSENKVEFNIHYAYYLGNEVIRKYLTKGIWKKINFDTHKIINVKEKIDKCYRDFSKIQEKYKKKIEFQKDELQKLFREHLDKNKDEIIKIFNKRIKQVELQTKRTNESKNRKSNNLEIIRNILLNLGYQVSKVVSGGYYGDYCVTKRKIDDKYHKYIKTDSKNIKFATIEIKINNDKCKLGYKIETRGQIGCQLSEVEDIFNKMKKEKETICTELKEIGIADFVEKVEE